MTRNAFEFKLQIAIIKHHKKAFPYVKAIHIPNESRDATEGFFNKMMGVEPGASDLLLGWNAKLYGGIGTAVVEIKSKDGRISTPQNRFLSWADDIGWHTGVAKSVRQYHDLLCSFGLKPWCESIIEPDIRSSSEKIQAGIDFWRPR